MRVVVLGHRGMLGHVVTRFFAEQQIEALTLDRRFTPESRSEFIRAIQELQPAWCINCIGVAPGRGASPEQMRAANVLLPEALSTLPANGMNVLHASTDGVFRPDKPAREVQEHPDATDDYGAGKAAAEKSMLSSQATVIRCSIIGPELGPPKSLLGWALKQKAGISGFTNQTWNGITTLEWARLAFKVLTGTAPASAPSSPSPIPQQRDGGEGRGEEAPYNAAILQPGFLPAVSKFDLLRLIISEWHTGASVTPTEAKQPVARWLVPNTPSPSLKKQLNELHRWY